jgi:hypothetical protein
VRALLEKGEAEIQGPVPARLVLAEGNTPEIVDADGKPIAETLALGSCPNGDGDIRENRAAFGCTSFKSKKEPGCGFTIWKTQGSFTITADDVRRLLADGEAPLESAVPARLVMAEGNTPLIVDEQGKPLTGALGPCPNGDGEIKENRKAFGCTSFKSKDEPGCGFTIWKTQKGFTVGETDVRALLEHGEATLVDGPQPAKLVMAEGNVPQIVGLDGAPLVRSAVKVVRETIATCPRCGGDIRGNSRAYGCSSWKSRKNPGCGFVIWKSTKGRDITPEEAKQVIEQGSTGPLEFRDRQGAFVGRLVLTDDKSVDVQRADSASAAA